jgi:hypothetical protein
MTDLCGFDKQDNGKFNGSSKGQPVQTATVVVPLHHISIHAI